MKKIIIALFLFTSINAFTQNENVTREELEKKIKPLIENVKTIQTENGNLKKDIQRLNTKLSNAAVKLDSVQLITKENSNTISKTNKELGIRIQETGKTSDEKIFIIGKLLSNRSLYGFFAVLCTILVSFIIYWLLSKRQKTDKMDIEGLILNTKKSLLEASARLDSKLVDLLETQLKIIQEENLLKRSVLDDKEIDHTVPLKVADEITRINAYANTLNPDSQDSKALKSSVKRLINTFKTAQYEIIDLLGQKYDDGLKIIVVNAFPDEKLKFGDEVISRIIKPLVKYKGEQIQAAQVDISIGQ